MAVLKGGNNPFMNIVAPTPQPALHEAALQEALDSYRDEFLSEVFVGLRQGIMDGAYEVLARLNLRPRHPRQAFEAVIAALQAHPEWYA